MKGTTIDVLFAVFTTLIVVGPVVALLWFSWRAVVVGALTIAAVLLFFGSMLAAGGSGWNPGGNPAAIVALGWTVAAICAVAAYLLGGRGVGLKVLNVVLGYVVLIWAGTMWHHLMNAWWAVGHPEEPPVALTAEQLAQGRQRDSAEAAELARRLILRAIDGTETAVAERRDLDVLYLIPGTDSSTRVLALLEDPEIQSLTRDRGRVLVIPDGYAADLRPRPSYPSRKYPLTVERAPGFYDRERRAISVSPYRWLVNVLLMPEEHAKRIYLRHFETMEP